MRNREPHYHQFLEEKLQETHAYYHELEKQIQEQKKVNAKLLKQISQLRKKQNDNKLTIKEMKGKIDELQIQIRSFKNPPPKKPPINRDNILQQSKDKTLELTPKQVFKQFLNDNFPKYRDTIKKLIALVLYFQRHWAKSEVQRIKTYHNHISCGINQLLQFILPSPKSLQNFGNINNQTDYTAVSIIQEWNNSDSKLKEVVREYTLLKRRENQYLQKIQSLESSQAKLMMKLKTLEAKNYSYQFTLKAKAAQWVVHLKKLLNEKLKIVNQDLQIDEQAYVKYQNQLETILSIMKQVASKTINKKQDLIVQPTHEVTSNKLNENRLGSKKLKMAAPVIKKNIYGYYQQPQFHHNKPTLSKTVPSNNYSHKLIQTTPDDQTINTRYPILLLTVIDGKIRSAYNRHRLDFYVRISSENPQQMSQTLSPFSSINSKVQQGLEPVWNEKLLIKDYRFPFLHFSLMNTTKLSLRDEQIGQGKLQIAQKNIPKQVTIRNQRKQFQGKIRLELTYPKCAVYLFTINSIEFIYPKTEKLLNETIILNFPYNPESAIHFNAGQKLKYLNYQIQEKHYGNIKYKNHYQFLLIPGYESKQNKLRIKLLQNKKKGVKSISEQSAWTQQTDNNSFFSKTIRIQIKQTENWEVVLQGTILTLISENDQPQRIEEQQLGEGSQKYFSLLASHPIIKVIYGEQVLLSHIKLPLVFRYNQQINELLIAKLFSENNDQNQGQDQLIEETLSPITSPNNTVIDEEAIKLIPSLKAPPVIYTIHIKTLEGPSDIRISNNQYHYEKLLEKLELEVTLLNSVKTKFTIFSSQMIQNYYVTMNKMFQKDFVKFQIGFSKHQNLLKMPGFEEKPESEEQSEENIEQLQSENGQGFVTFDIEDGRLPSFSTTSSYQLNFIPQQGQNEQNKKQFKNKPITSKLSESVNGRPTWNQKLVVPFKKQLKLQIIESPLLGNSSVIYETENFQITEIHLKLKILFVNILQKEHKVGGDHIILGNINALTSLYKIKVSKIHAEIDEKADWIGQIDPYIKFYDPCLKSILYQTQTLDGKGNSPTWNSDQFENFLAMNKLACYIYDSDIIGKDDYLGIAYFNLEAALSQKYNNNSKISIDIEKGTNKYYVKNISGTIRKQEQQCGKLQLFGEFKRYGGRPILLPNKHKYLELFKSSNKLVFKVSIFSLKLNHNYLNENEAFFQYADQTCSSYNKRSNYFTLKDNATVDFCFWPKNVSYDGECSLKIDLYQIKQTLFSSNTEHLGQCVIKFEKAVFSRHPLFFGKAEVYLCEGQDRQTMIGELFYIFERTIEINYMVIEGASIMKIQDEDHSKLGQLWCDRQKGGNIIISDVGDSVVIGDEDDLAGEEGNPRILFYLQKWQMVHPDNVDNSSQTLMTEEQETDYGNLIAILEKPFKTVYGNLLIHRYKYQSDIESSKQLRSQIQDNYITYSLTHAYFSPMDKAFFSKLSGSEQQTLDSLFICFSNQNSKQNANYRSETQVSLSKLINNKQKIPLYLSVTSKVCSFYLEIIDKADKKIKLIVPKQKMVIVSACRNKINEEKLKFAKCIKYNGTKYLLSVQFIKTSLINTQILAINWAYFQVYPCLPYGIYKSLQKILKKIKDTQNHLQFVVSFDKQEEDWAYKIDMAAYGTQQRDDEQLFSGTMAMAIKELGNQLLDSVDMSYGNGMTVIHNLSALLRNIWIPLPIHSAPQTNIQIKLLVQSVSQEPQQFKLLQIVPKQRNQINKSFVECGNFNCLSINKQDILNYGGLAYDKACFHGEYRFQKQRISQQTKSRQTTRMQIIKLSEISISLNQKITSQYHSSSFQQFIELHLIEPNTKTSTICQLITQPTKSKNLQFGFKGSQSQNTLQQCIFIPDLQEKVDERNKEEEIRVQIWSGVKREQKGIFNFLNKSEKIVVGLCYFGKSSQSLTVQLKEAKTKKAMTVGKLVIKYNYLYRDVNRICEEIFVDSIVIQNAKQLSYNPLKLEYYPTHKTPPQFRYTLRAEASSKQTNLQKNMSIYNFEAPIILSDPPMPLALQISNYNTISQKQTLICEIPQFDRCLGQIPENQSRWSTEVKLGNITKLLLAGYRSGKLSLLDCQQKMEDDKKKDASGKQLITLCLSQFHNLCPSDSKLTLEIETAGSTIRTKSLNFKNEEHFRAIFILDRLNCDYLRVQILGENKKMPIYTSEEIQYRDYLDVLPFHVSNTGEKFTKVFMGTCQWAASPYNQGIPTDSKSLVVELVSTSVEIFSDSEWFAEMNPYLEINDYFATPVSIGKQQLFWNLKIFLPLSAESASQMINIVVKDKDMFYDDVIGNAKLPIVDILNHYEKDRLENMGNIELTAEIPIYDQKKVEQMVGHIKLHYIVHEVQHTQEPEFLKGQDDHQKINGCIANIQLASLQQYVQINHPKIFKQMREPRNQDEQVIDIGIFYRDETRVQTKKYDTKMVQICKFNLNSAYTNYQKPSLKFIRLPLLYTRQLNVSQLSKKLNMRALVSNNKQYQKQPLNVTINMSPKLEIQAMSTPIKQASEYVCLLQSMTFHLNGPKFNRCDTNLKVEIITQQMKNSLIIGQKGCIGNISSSKFSPQLLQISLKFPAQRNMITEEIPLKIINLQDRNTHKISLKLVINDNQTGFTCICSFDQKVDMENGLNRKIISGEVYENYISRKNHRQGDNIGIVYFVLNFQPSQIEGLKKIEEMNRNEIRELKNIGESSIEARKTKMTIKGAKLYKDIQIFSKMDPYCEVYIQKNKGQFEKVYRTQTQDNKGKNPEWNQCLYLSLKNSKISVYVKIMDEEMTINKPIADGFFEFEFQKDDESQSHQITVKLYESSKNYKISSKEELGLLYLALEKPTNFNITFTSVEYIDSSRNWSKKFDLYFTELDQKNSYGQIRKVQLNYQYPLNFNFGNSIGFSLDNQMKDITSGQKWKIKDLIGKCDRCENQLILMRPGVVLRYILSL